MKRLEDNNTMNYKQFSNLSCYEEFEIQCDLHGISKIDVLKEIGDKINDYYFFVSNDGVFNWFDLSGNHVENPGILKKLYEEYIPKSITKCIIPDSVTSIGNYVFSSCRSLKSITIPNSITSIGNNSFWNCESLKEITIPDSVTSIDDSAFYSCESLKEITIPNSVTSIGDWAFYSCRSLEEITIPGCVTSIGYNAFCFCDSLKEVNFKGKTLEKVKQMACYPFGIKDESIIKVSEI